MPLQFQNPANPDVYQRTLGPEILADLANKPLAAFVAGAGSGGTFAGIQKALQDAYPELKGYIVEPAGSILNGGPAHSHRTEGIGVEFIPPASLEVAKELPHGANLVTVFPDSSERYLSEHIYEE